MFNQRTASSALEGSIWGSYGPSLIATRSTRNRRSLRGRVSCTMAIYIFLHHRFSAPLSLRISFPLLTGSSITSSRIMLAAHQWFRPGGPFHHGPVAGC